MAEVVYTLCALASALCTVLLYAGWRRSGVRLLMWSAVCFLLFFVNNALLFVDHVVYTDLDLRTPRGISGALGPAVLLAGLIWDSGRREPR